MPDHSSLYVQRLAHELGSRLDERVRSVLEVGRGPERLADAFARRRFHVTAVDLQQLETIGASDRVFDLVTCVFVLRDMAHSDALALIETLVARVSMGGFLHLEFPFRTHRSRIGRASLAMRERIPGLNAIANRLRHRPADAPLRVPRVHSLDDVISLLNKLNCSIEHLGCEVQNELEVVRLTASVGRNPSIALTIDAPTVSRDANFIDVRELMRDTPLNEWNRRAEEYFSGLTTYDAQLAKPFASPTDAPSMLVNAGTVLQALRVLPGMTIIDFGAGTGWLTRALAQLGCHVISIDASQSALDIAKRDFESRPLIGNPSTPTYLRFDGTRIALDDASVDRIVCFDAFHHVPNPAVVMREFARVLKPGGLAAFSEPGPNHSKSAQSQFEMRTYGVLENDVELHELWPIAQDAGFVDIRVGVFLGEAQFIPLENFDDLLNGGHAFVESARWMRQFLENIRLFTLRKAGEEQLDSRSAHALRAEIEITLRNEPRANEPIAIHTTLRNTGKARWLPSPTTPGGVCLGVHLYANGELASFDHHWAQLPAHGMQPGETAELELQLPPLAPGSYELEFDCVAQQVTWFAMNGSPTTRLALEIR